MADNDYNIIKPVESLYNIAGLTPVERRQERKRRDNLNPEHKEEPKQDLNESPEQENTTTKSDGDENNQHSIDYCA